MAHPSFSGVVARLTDLYTASASMPYGAAGMELLVDPLTGLNGAVGFLAHALQCAQQAAAAHPDDVELRVAALLHDVGWLLPKPADASLLTAAGVEDARPEDGLARHDLTGSAFLCKLGFPPRVCKIVAGHVQAKRYLTAMQPSYYDTLSEGSKHTLRLQGGPMAAEEVTAFEADPDFSLICAVRRWDEGAKVPGKSVPDWDHYTADMQAVLAAQLFQPFSSQCGGLRMEAVLPEGAATALGPDGPGYIVVRNWLSAAEVAAVQQYARDFVPSLPDEQVHHTWERRGDKEEDVVLSRTEFFAHIADDTDQVGPRLLLGTDGTPSRLSELCAALRGGRTQTLYKEKQNYKLKAMAGGSTGGYLAHQDFYHGFDAVTGERQQLLPDDHICVCMLAVDDIDEGNGGAEVAAGWHNRGPLTFNTVGSALPLAHMEAGRAANELQKNIVDEASLPWTPITLAPGDVLIYGNLMPHRSARNTSERDRRALFGVYADVAKAGSAIRELYYAYEAQHRRAKNSVSTGGKANHFFDGQPVLRGA